MPNFVSVAASIAELAHGEKLRTHSLDQSPSLCDALGTEAEACTSELVTALAKGAVRAAGAVLVTPH